VHPASEFRVLVQPEQECRGALVIEALDRSEAVREVSVFGPRGSLADGLALAKAVWDALPRGLVLREAYPETVASWRIGLFACSEDDDPWLEVLRECEGRPHSRLPPDLQKPLGQQRSMVLPLVTCRSYGLPDRTPAMALESGARIADWTVVHFSSR
jgi:hypothetical protein